MSIISKLFKKRSGNIVLTPEEAYADPEVKKTEEAKSVPPEDEPALEQESAAQSGQTEEAEAPAETPDESEAPAEASETAEA